MELIYSKQRQLKYTLSPKVLFASSEGKIWEKIITFSIPCRTSAPLNFTKSP